MWLGKSVKDLDFSKKPFPHNYTGHQYLLPHSHLIESLCVFFHVLKTHAFTRFCGFAHVMS